MSFIQNFFTSRDNNANTETYVGQKDRLWYNPDTNSIRVSDGVTPGGLVVDLETNANASFNSITANTGTINGNLVITGNISPAANNKIGGIKPGPGVDISNDGLLTIDTANLPLSFGDFTASNNVLSIVNIDEDMVLQTNGNAEIQLVGNIGFYKPDGLPPNVANRYFSATSDGQIKILVPDADPLAGAVNIIGSTSGNFSPPVNTGVMLQLTGQANIPSRLYNDGIGTFAAFVGRRINGTVTSPTPVQAGDELIRISSTGYNGNTVAGSGSARIVYQAMENFTTTNAGSNLSFWTCAIGSNTLTKIATIDSANGLVATKISSTDNVVAGNTFRYDVSNNNATATQLTSKATAVTCNGRTGQITMNNSSIAKGEAITFTVNNTYITAVTDVPIVAIQNGVTANSYSISVTRVQVGSFNITLTNNGTGALTDTPIVNFAVIKVS